MHVISKLYDPLAKNALHGAHRDQQPQFAQAEFVPSREQISFAVPQFSKITLSSRSSRRLKLATLQFLHCGVAQAVGFAALQYFSNETVISLRDLTHIQTLNRELRCIRKACTYLLVIRPTRAVPHPPTPPAARAK
jgi:hypothetical protein